MRYNRQNESVMGPLIVSQQSFVHQNLVAAYYDIFILHLISLDYAIYGPLFSFSLVYYQSVPFFKAIFLQALLYIGHFQLTLFNSLQLSILQLECMVCFSTPKVAVCCNVEEITLPHFLTTPNYFCNNIKTTPPVLFQPPFQLKRFRKLVSLFISPKIIFPSTM